MSFAEPASEARFLYELAERLHKTVGELVALMDDPAELTGWKALLLQRATEREQAEQRARSDEAFRAYQRRGMGR